MSADHPRILIIDDEFQIRRFLRISLASQGHEVIEAATGGEGLVRAIGDQPDLVLLDLGLPDIDGREVLQTIRSQSDVPVIVVSVRASEREKVACLDAGASDYVTKPFGIQELLARVRAALRQQVSSAGPALTRQRHVGELSVDPDTHRVTLGGEPVRLTRVCGPDAAGRTPRAADHPDPAAA